LGRRISSGEIVGREDALCEIQRLLAQPPGILLFVGEAGIGKSRLARAAEERAQSFALMHGEAIEVGGEDLAYGPLNAALRGLGFPTGESQARIFELLLERLAGAAPALLVLEDLHWADRSTRAFLGFLARNLTDERIAVIATFRGDGQRELLSELGRRPIVTRIDLGPLTPDEVMRQLDAIAGAPVPAALAADLHERSGGNPFFVEELYAARADGVPASISDAVLIRVDRLDRASRHPLELIAAAGGRLDHALLGAPAGVHAALDAGLVVREHDDRGIAFRHGLIGEVLYARLLPAERAERHRELAAALGLDAPAAQRAHQCHRAGLRAEALAASVEAGLEAAGAHAFAEAGAHFERALELWDPAVELPLDHVELLARAAQAARFAGADERALARCREAIAETTDPLRAARLYERLGEYHYWDDEAALECYEQALRLLGDGPSLERSRLLAAEGHALMGLRRWSEARERCEAALDAGAGPRITLAVVLAFLGEAEAAEAYARDALELAETAEDTARAYLHLAEVQRVRGDHPGALQTMGEGEAVAERLGLRGSFGRFMHVNAAVDLVRLGRWDEAALRLTGAGRMDLSVTAAAMCHATAAQLHALRGEIAEAHAALARVSDGALPSEFVAPLGAARATLALSERDPAAALAHVEAALAAIGDAHDPLYVPELYSLGARAAAALGERSSLLERLEGVLAQAAPPDALAHRALARAELTGEGWDDAARAWQELAEPYPAAYARLRAAEAALPGDRAAAAEALAQAHASAVALGAAPLREDAEALARRARLPIVAPATPARASAAGLTARETEVLQALADGLTNREIGERLFISQKTVAAHLAHIFDKLGVHTRVEAAGRAYRLGVLQRASGPIGAAPEGDPAQP
jgi:DNA-binding CsgD family transcriptional regulator/tetratricopeptide (TPR) repeat protein